VGPLLKFFGLTFLASWALFAAAAAAEGNALRTALFLAGTIVPAVVAIALTLASEGRAGTRTLLSRILNAPAGARFYVFAVTYMAAVKLGVALAHRAMTGAWPSFGQTPLVVMMAAIVVSTPVQAGEEVGWRGYALPRLAARFGLARASLALGVIWACWHVPFFFIPGSGNAGQSFPVYLLAVTAISVAMAWLYWRTGGSLLLTMLMHAAVNNTAGIVASPPDATLRPFSLHTSITAWTTAALLWVGAVCFLVRMRRVAVPAMEPKTWN
jgi:membrane protease YdiL (CAAX protease family)